MKGRKWPTFTPPATTQCRRYRGRVLLRRLQLAEQFVDEGMFGDIPDHLANYIDMDAIARDLDMDYTETEVAGQMVVYRVT